MDIAVGVVGLMDICARTLIAARQYAHCAKHARESAGTLIREIEVFKSCLDRLKRLNETSGQWIAPKDSVLVNLVVACTVTLKNIEPQLGKYQAGGRNRWTWPLKESDFKSYIHDLRQAGQWIQLSLTLDNTDFLAGTSKDILQALGKQLQSFEIASQQHSQIKKEITGIGKIITNIERRQLQHSSDLELERLKQQRISIGEWLSKTNEEEKHHAAQQPRIQGTGGWLLEHPKYVAWRDGTKADSVLWCYGIQGSGKSVLASTVIDDLLLRKVNETLLSFLYIDYRSSDSQSPEEMLARLLKQIVRDPGSDISCAVSMYEKHRNQRQSLRIYELLECITKICNAFDGEVSFVVDALDEFLDTGQRSRFIHALNQLASNKNCRLFITSRPHLEDIKRAFGVKPHLEVRASESDLRRYLDDRIETSGLSDIINDDLHKKIVSAIVYAAKGLFLLPILQLQVILQEVTPGSMEDAIPHIPKDLPTAFGESLGRIQQQGQGRSKLALEILKWLTLAKAKLCSIALRTALAVRPNTSAFDQRYMPATRLLTECCMGLVTIDSGTDEVRFAHYSIKEYFRTRVSDLFPDGEREIAATCIIYLSYNVFTRGCCGTEEEIKERLENYRLLEYSAKHWGRHVANADCDEINRLALEFLRCPERRASVWQARQYTLGRLDIYWEANEAVTAHALGMASEHGYLPLVRALLVDYGMDINIQTHIGTTALIKAASNGHLELTAFLLSQGADYGLSNWYGNCLHCAAYAGQHDVIGLLLEHGMDIDIKTQDGYTAIEYAAFNENFQTVKFLYDRGASCSLRRIINIITRKYTVDTFPEDLLDLFTYKSVDTS